MIRTVHGLVCGATLVALAAGFPAVAQQRPSEEEIFGKPAEPPPVPAPAPRPNEGEIFGTTPQTGETPPAPEPRIRENPLAIGGLVYLRALSQWQQGAPPADWFLAAPALVDGYLDVRPNDRVRGFLLARLQYDLARSTTEASAITPPAGAPGGVAESGTVVSNNLFLVTQNPRMLLDQLWVNFDVEHTAFVTAGKQHVKWGTAHFWNPTDFLHPVRRDPLAVFDARTGLTMVKLHVPWEKRGWNFYGMGFFDETRPVGALSNIGAAARAEAVFGTAEVGIDGLVERGRDPRLGVDFSAGIWDLDVYGEAALRHGSDIPLWRPLPQPNLAAPGLLRKFYETYVPDFAPQVAAGVSWSWKYSDEDTLTLGAEYFYNGAGYPDATLYPIAIAGQVLEGQTYFVPFYLGKHYAGAYLLLPKPGSWNDTTFTLSTIGNLSDRTYVTRLDYSVLILTYLTVEAYVGAHYGERGGEFRFALDQPQLVDPATGQVFGPFHIAPPVVDVGVALRVSL